MKTRNRLDEKFCRDVHYNEIWYNERDNQYIDGNCLYLQVEKGDVKSWLVRSEYQGRLYKVRAGLYPEMTLEKAREARDSIVGAYISKGLAPTPYEYTMRETDKKRYEYKRKSSVDTFKDALLLVRGTPLGASVAELRTAYGSLNQAAAYRVAEYKEVCDLNTVSKVLKISDPVLYGLADGKYPLYGSEISVKMLYRLGVLADPKTVIAKPEPEPEPVAPAPAPEPVSAYTAESIDQMGRSAWRGIAAEVRPLLEVLSFLDKDSPASVSIIEIIKSKLP